MMTDCWIIKGIKKGKDFYWTKNKNFRDISKCRVFMDKEFALKQVQKAIEYIENSDDILWGECKIVPCILKEKYDTKNR